MTQRRRPTSCTQADITRLIKAALAAGLGAERITGIKLTRDGAILLLQPVQVDAAEPPPARAMGVADDSWSDIDAA